MIQATELLQAHLRLLRRLSGAGSVTLFCPPLANDATGFLLLRDGGLDPVDELARGTGDALERLERDRAELQALDAHPRVACWIGSAHDRLLFRIDSGDAPTRPRRRRSDQQVSGHSSAAWIGLRFCGDDVEPADRLKRFGAGSGAPDGRAEESPGLSLIVLVADLARHGLQVSAILDDPVTGLPGRSEFQALLEQDMEEAGRMKRPLALLLTNPDGFASVNERFGREAGDAVIREMGAKLREIHRSSDQIARYGGAIFSSILVDTAAAGARVAATKVLRSLSETSFFDGAVRLGFSVGMATFDPTENPVPSTFDLIRSADQALYAAKRSGGGQLAVWDEDSANETVPDLTAMGGLFTGDTAKDYRNMVLLWESVTVMAAHSRFEELAAKVAERLHTTFKPERVLIFGPSDDGKPPLIQGHASPVEGDEPEHGSELSEEQCALVRRAASERATARDTVRGRDPDADRLAAYAIPLVTDSCDLGCLYLDGRADALALDSADLFFLEALAAQLAVGLDRARLAEQESRGREQESRRLRTELEALRTGVDRVELEFRSPQMNLLLETTRRVATTDAAVLITGESGTGKELLARTIHAVSRRRDKPLVIVDCGAIAESLIDNELFGHERGAYTGAQERRIGRLAEADGATVLLDEIGELPLEVQTKLLRFVQEKQLTPVGGSKPRVIDARVIAATNVDLAERVAAGHFREDLFYRLNVVRLEVPPLRERVDDILHLAAHYLDKYAALYEKGARRITPEARDLMRAHGWPGNVRELQNRIMQAVILSETEDLGPEHFGLTAGSANVEVDQNAATAEPSSAALGGPAPAMESRERLRSALARQVDAALGSGARLGLPMGKWLSDDLVLAADGAVNGVARRGAALLGLPQTTFRRRLSKAAERERAGLSPRPNTWTEVRDALADLVSRSGSDGEDLLEVVQRMLRDEVASRLPDDTRTAAALLGVTEPTYLRRLA